MIVMFAIIIGGPYFIPVEKVEPPPTIKFMLGPNSVLDRGYAEYNVGDFITEPANYRWQDEGWGYCLYIYDNCATLKARVVNPAWVIVSD